MANGNSKCSGYCAPFYIYAFLAVVGTIAQLIAAVSVDRTVNNGAHEAILILTHIVLAVLWASLIYWFCTKCWYGAAWVALLLPFLFVIILLVLLVVVLLAVARGRGRSIPAYPVQPAHRGLPNADYWSPVLA